MNIDKKPNIAKRAMFVIFTFLTVCAIMLSGFCALLTLLFLSNFNFSNLWHLFVFAFTLLAPFISIAGYLSIRSSHKLGLRFASALAALCPLLVPVIWSFEASRGLAH